MGSRLSFRRGITAAIACGAVACGLGTSGLMDDEIDASVPGSTLSPNGPVSGGSGSGSGNASSSSGGSSSGASGSGGSSSGGGSSGGGSGDDAAGPPGDSASPTEDDATVPFDSAIPDVGPPDVHVLDPDAAYADSGDPCDLDEDGYRAMGTCGGNDCCDYDSRANPGDTTYYPTADACGSFDYNCDGQLEQQYATANCQLGFFTCNGEGFDKTPPACGVPATFDTCDYNVVYCGTTQSSKPQTCK